MDAVSLDLRFAITVLVEILVAALLAWRLLAGWKRRALGGVVLVAVLAAEATAYDLLVAEQDEVPMQWLVHPHVTIVFWEMKSPRLGIVTLRAIGIENRGADAHPQSVDACSTERGHAVSVTLRGAERTVRDDGSIILITANPASSTVSRAPIFEELWRHRDEITRWSSFERLAPADAPEEWRLWRYLRSLDRAKMDEPLRRFLELEDR